MSERDPYQILGVSRTATQDEIKRAYRRLAKEHHPDRNPDDKGAEQRFKEVQAAYEVLGDPQKRAQYDRFGAGGPAPNVREWNMGGSPFEDVRVDFGSMGDLTSIFEQFFSRGRGGSGRGPRARRSAPARKGADIEHVVEISFEEAAQGTRREVLLRTADGATDRIEVRIPAGVTDGQRIRVRGQGQEGAGGRGDLMIRCLVRPHAYFRREGLDVLLDLPLTFAEATLGARVEIPTPDGPTVLSVPAGTSSGAKLRLRGRGMKNERSGQRGDMYAVVRVQVPREVSDEARALIDQLDGALKQQPRAFLSWAL